MKTLIKHLPFPCIYQLIISLVQLIKSYQSVLIRFCIYSPVYLNNIDITTLCLQSFIILSFIKHSFMQSFITSYIFKLVCKQNPPITMFCTLIITRYFVHQASEVKSKDLPRVDSLLPLRPLINGSSSSQLLLCSTLPHLQL